MLQFEELFRNDVCEVTGATDILAGHGDLLIAFTGIGHAMGAIDVQRPEFVGAGIRLGGIIIVSDLTRSWGNAIDFEYLARILKPHIGDRTVYCIGNSMGGFLAVIASNYIPMRAVVSFAPQFSVSPEVLPEERRFERYTKNIERFKYKSLDGWFREKVRYYMFFGGDKSEKRHWSRFKPTNNVQQVIVDGEGHGIAVFFKQNRLLNDVVDSCFDGSFGIKKCTQWFGDACKLDERKAIRIACVQDKNTDQSDNRAPTRVAGANKRVGGSFEKNRSWSAKVNVSSSSGENMIVSDKTQHTNSVEKDTGTLWCVEAPKIGDARNVFLDFFENDQHKIMQKWDNYFDIYERHLTRFLQKPIVFLEIGVSQGGSLDMWRHCFGPDALIVGVDVNPNCMRYEQEKTKIFVGDQGDRGFWESVLNEIPPPTVVLDDGGHRMDQQIATFEALFPHMDPYGVYMCEDTHTSYSQAFGGGYKEPSSFIEYAKGFIDLLHAWHIHRSKDVTVTEFTRSTPSVHFYDGIVVVERKPTEKPKMVQK